MHGHNQIHFSNWAPPFFGWQYYTQAAQSPNLFLYTCATAAAASLPKDPKCEVSLAMAWEVEIIKKVQPKKLSMKLQLNISQ